MLDAAVDAVYELREVHYLEMIFDKIEISFPTHTHLCRNIFIIHCDSVPTEWTKWKLCLPDLISKHSSQTHQQINFNPIRCEIVEKKRRKISAKNSQRILSYVQ